MHIDLTLTVRSLRSLSDDELRQAARDRATAGDPCSHPFAQGSREAILFEHAYTERARQLEEQEG